MNTLDGNEVLNLGPQAKYILSKDVDKICDCLVAMAVSGMRDHDSRTLWDDLMQLIRRSQSEDEDTEYEMKISRRIATELCFLSSEYSNCCSFVADNIELFFFEAIQFLLDPNRLEIYPSCHFELISEMGGEKAAKEALLALDLFDGEESSRPWNITIEDFESILELHIKRRTRAEFPWKIIESLTSVASKRSHSFTVILEDFVRALPTSFEESLSVASLEKESFVCFTCLRKVVSALAKSNIQLFEKMSAGILCFMASQLLRIVQGLRYLDQTILEGSLERSSPDGRTRVFCLFGAYSELFIALSAWILRETPAGMSGGWITLQSQLCEKIFYPLLRRQQSDMTSNLKVVMQSCRSISGSITPSTLPFSVIAGCTQYFEPFFDIALRRCHQLVSAPIQSSVLQNYLIEGLCLSEQDREVSIAKLIGNAFKAAPRDPCLLSQGPLQDEIDKYLSFVELNMPSSECESNMAQKRFEAMRSVIIPRISQRNGNLDVKRKILRVAIHILSSSDALKNVNSICKVSDLIASFVKSLRHTTFQSMISKFVDSNLISVLFSCAAKLAQLNISEDPCSDEISLLGQSDNAVAQLESCDLSILCESELKSLYFHTFFQWMFKLASKIARETEVANVHGQVYRFRALCSKVNQEVPDDSLLSDMILSPNDDEKSASLENWTKAVVWIEDKVFRSKSENVRPVVNVYSKPSVNSTDGDKTEYTLEPWRPSSGVTRSAKEYMADILYMSV